MQIAEKSLNLQYHLTDLTGMNDEQRVNQYDEAFSLMADEIGIIDTKIMGVYGAMRRGATKEEALRKYDLSEKVYDENIDRVLNS